MTEKLDYSFITQTALKNLKILAGYPMTSYFEDAGANFVEKVCRDLGMDVQVDTWGNVLASRQGTNPDAPGLAFVAHLDHPGFIAHDKEDNEVLARIVGGVPVTGGLVGVPVFTLQPNSQNESGDIKELRVPGLITSCGGDDDKETVINISFERELDRLPAPVMFDLPDLRIDSDRIFMRAADDLAGCASILAALIGTKTNESSGSVYGVFTRAEEDGLIGARLMAEEGLLPKDTVVVSVETSQEVPGGEQEKGPVIRTGDRATTFDNAAEAHLIVAANSLTNKLDSFKVQRQLMGAGGCEASAFSAFGYKVTGVAYPLHNWHNNGPGSTIMAENISIADFNNGAILLAQTMLSAGEKVYSPYSQRLSEPVPENVRNTLSSSRIRKEYS